jgi:hypothetical protein
MKAKMLMEQIIEMINKITSTSISMNYTIFPSNVVYMNFNIVLLKLVLHYNFINFLHTLLF